MKISKLRFKDCLGIEEMEFSAGKINMISGGNERGKTSILETIEKALYNTDRRPKFVKGDSGKAEIYLELDNGIEINRTVKDGGKSTLKVTKDGLKPAGPETYLKALLGKYALVFNPIDFLSKKDKEQADILLEQIPIKVTKEDALKWYGEAPEISYDQHGLVVCKILEKLFFEARKERNADIKSADGEIEFIKGELPNGYNADEWREVNLSDYYQSISDANKVNTNLIKCQSQLNNSSIKISSIETERDLKIKQLEEKIQALKDEATQKINEENQNVEIAKQYIADHAPIDIEPLEKAQEEAEKMKGYIGQYDNLQRITKERDEDAKSRDSYEEKLKDVRRKPAELLASAPMPIEGLGVDDTGNITIDGLPIRNLSTSKQIRLALDIARATAGELKMICIDRFESLDPDVQKIFLQEIANDDFQYFITTVGAGELQIKATLESGVQIDAFTGELI